jgi:hypothetical protein
VALAAEVRGFSVAFFVILMYGSVLPFKMGLSKVPFLHAFTFSIPFTCVLFTGIRLIPRFGTATFLICGHSLFTRVVSRGIIPLWWPYAVVESLTLEGYFLLTKDYLNKPLSVICAGTLRGLVVYLYFISYPLIWHKFYVPRYITIQTIQGVVGSILGGIFGYKLSKIIEKGYKYGSMRTKSLAFLRIRRMILV